MISLLDLPPEILTHIVAYVGQDERENEIKPDLISVRLTSRTLANIANRHLFETVYAHPSEKNCRELEKIIDKGLFDSTRKIIIIICPGCLPENQQYKPREIPPMVHREPLSPAPDFEALISRLTNLRSAGLRMCRNHGELAEKVHNVRLIQSNDIYDIGWKLFCLSLASSADNLRELIMNGIPYNPHEKDQLAFIRHAVSGLEVLRMKVLNVDMNLIPEMRDEAAPFFRDLPDLWFRPCMNTLQHLTLHCIRPFGVYPKFHWKDIYFPCLQTLKLQNQQFCHDSQLDWILSHGATLHTLYMDSPTIIYCAHVHEDHLENFYVDGSEMEQNPRAPGMWCHRYPKRWHDYLEAFQKLPHLRKFRISSTEEPEYDDRHEMFERDIRDFVREGYTYFFDRHFRNMGYAAAGFHHAYRPQCVKEDLEALRPLIEIDDEAWDEALDDLDRERTGL